MSCLSPCHGLYRKHFELILVFDAIACGGEHYLLRWDEPYYDHHFHVPNFSWPIFKQIDEQCMVFVPTMPFFPKAYLVDICHCYCGYFIVEKGASHNWQVW